MGADPQRTVGLRRSVADLERPGLRFGKQAKPSKPERRRLLQSRARLYHDAAETTDLSTRQCSLDVSAKDLAVIGATLADGGINPVTGVPVVDPSTCHYALAVMATAGMYETSAIGSRDRPSRQEQHRRRNRHGVAGKGRARRLAPPLDAARNSVKGKLVAKYLSQRLGMDLFASKPASGRGSTMNAQLRARPPPARRIDGHICIQPAAAGRVHAHDARGSALYGGVDDERGAGGLQRCNVVLIAALFVVGDSLMRTGVAQKLGDWLTGKARSNEARLIVLLMVVVCSLGATMSSTAVTAVSFRSRCASRRAPG